MIYRGGGGLSFGLGVVVEMVVVFLGFLEDRATRSDRYFRYEGSGVGGESRNRDLRVCLDVFQILGFR